MNLHETLAFAHEMHAGVNDWTGAPYITHPVAVMLMLPVECCEDDQHIALLHDVLEDCKQRLRVKFDGWDMPADDDKFLDYVLDRLETIGYSSYVVQGLRLLTRDFWPNLSYINYVKNIVSSGHRGAMWVKYCDNMHNTDPVRQARLSPELCKQSLQMSTRYEHSKRILREGLGIQET